MRYNSPCVCGRSSSGRARPCQGRGSEFEPRRPLQKETPSVRMVFSFWSGRFCCAKSVACGRVIEREWGNPQRFPPHTPPSLRWVGVRFFVSDGVLASRRGLARNDNARSRYGQRGCRGRCLQKICGFLHGNAVHDVIKCSVNLREGRDMDWN